MSFFEWFYKVAIVQGICVFIVVLTVVISKLFLPEIFAEMKDFYKENLTSDTLVSEVLDSEI